MKEAGNTKGLLSYNLIKYIVLKLIKVGSKKLTAIKLFFIANSRRILKIKKPKLIKF